MICRFFRNNHTHSERCFKLFTRKKRRILWKENYNNPFVSLPSCFGNKRIAVTFTSAFYCWGKKTSNLNKNFACYLMDFFVFKTCNTQSKQNRGKAFLVKKSLFLFPLSSNGERIKEITSTWLYCHQSNGKQSRIVSLFPFSSLFGCW